MNGMVEGWDGVSVVVLENRGRRLRNRACNGRTDAWFRMLAELSILH